MKTLFFQIKPFSSDSSQHSCHMLASLGTEAAASSVYAVILSRENVRLPGHLTDHAGHASEGGE